MTDASEYKYDARIHELEKRLRAAQSRPACKVCGADLDVMGGCMAERLHKLSLNSNPKNKEDALEQP